jgi:hypothetical protein
VRGVHSRKLTINIWVKKKKFFVKRRIKDKKMKAIFCPNSHKNELLQIKKSLPIHR